MKVSWAIFKNFIVTRTLSIQYVDLGQKYTLKAFDGFFSMECELSKVGEDQTDVTDFETNFKLAGNKPLQAKDTDGSPLSRLKIAPAGWTFQDHTFCFVTSKLNSIYSKKADGTDFNYTTMKFYEDIGGVETLMVNPLQTDLDTRCIKTVVEWEPTHDYDVIGGEVRNVDLVNQDIRVWLIAVPDVPANLGGSKELITGGQSLKGKGEIAVDGRVVKHMVYSPIYHSNKLQIVLRHPIGLQASIEGCVDFYKA